MGIEITREVCTRGEGGRAREQSGGHAVGDSRECPWLRTKSEKGGGASRRKGELVIDK